MRRRPDPEGRRRALPGVATLGVAMVLSVVWLLMVRSYVDSGPGWSGLLAFHPSDFAVFLAATAAPLAALWLVAGYLLNGFALLRTQEAVRETQRQALRTSGDIEALIRTSIEMQEQARRQSFLNGAELALKDLNSQAGMITGRLGVLNAEETEYLWALNAAGDPWAFCHALLERSELEDDFVELVAQRVAGDEVASAGLQRFLRRYERLLALAKEYDADKLVREVLEDGPLDRLHALFQRVSARVQAMVGPPARPPGGDPMGDDTDAPPGPGPGPDDWVAMADGPPYAETPPGPPPPAPGYRRDSLGRSLGQGLASVLGPGGGVSRVFRDVHDRVLSATGRSTRPAQAAGAGSAAMMAYAGPTTYGTAGGDAGEDMSTTDRRRSAPPGPADQTGRRRAPAGVTPTGPSDAPRTGR